MPRRPRTAEPCSPRRPLRRYTSSSAAAHDTLSSLKPHTPRASVSSAIKGVLAGRRRRYTHDGQMDPRRGAAAGGAAGVMAGGAELGKNELQQRIDRAVDFQRSAYRSPSKFGSPSAFDADAANVFRTGKPKAPLASSASSASESSGGRRSCPPPARADAEAEEMPETFGKPLDLGGAGVALSKQRPGGLAASLGGDHTIEGHAALGALAGSTQGHIAYNPRPGLSFNNGVVTSK